MEESIEQTVLDNAGAFDETIEYDYTYDNEYDSIESYNYDDSFLTLDDSYSNISDDSSIGFLAGLLTGGLFLSIILVLAFVFLISIIANWKIFTKAGKPGWASIIPIYNTWVSFEIVNIQGWFAFASLVPVIGTIAAVVVAIIQKVRLAKVFGKPTEFSIGLILLPIIFLPILAFGNSQYLGKEAGGNELFK